MWHHEPGDSEVDHFRGVERRESAGHAQVLLEQFDQWLSQHDRDVQPSVDGSGRMRVGIGIYYFEENLNRMSKEEAP